MAFPKGLDLKEIGHTVQIAGVIFNSDKQKDSYLLMLPDEELYFERLDLTGDFCQLTDQEWKDFFWQSDVLETLATVDEDGKIQKAIIKKAERQISANISWNVYRRDQYKCRYCGIDNVPLTVDHIVLWEDGGPSIEENLVSSCRKCNRIRGNTKYMDWIQSDVYRKRSKKLSKYVRLQNEQLLDEIDKIPVSFVKLRGKKR